MTVSDNVRERKKPDGKKEETKARDRKNKRLEETIEEGRGENKEKGRMKRYGKTGGKVKRQNYEIGEQRNGNRRCGR